MSFPGKVEWLRVTPFFLLHAACLLVFVVGWSWIAVADALCAYFVRVFGLTPFYHHYFPPSARQGFRWCEIDISYYLLIVMSWFGLVWDLKTAPARVLNPTVSLHRERE